MAATVARYGNPNVSLTFTNDGGGGGGGGGGGAGRMGMGGGGFRGGNNFQGGAAGGSNDNMFNRPGYRFKSNMRAAEELMMGDGPGRRLRKNVANVRRHVDYIATILNYHESRLWQHSRRQRLCQQPDTLYQNSPLPPVATRDVPVDCILTKYVRAAVNKVKCPVYTLCWTPEGKRLITGASTGEFTLWNGTAFNFETILQAHDSAIRAMTWSYNEQWLVSGDHDGFIKYWQPNMNNVHMYQAHKDEPIRGLSFSPTDLKLVSGSDDGSARVWDFARCSEERVMRGHGSEVRCVQWHPQKGLIVTGSRDSQQPVKMWDPKSGQCLATLQDHKSSVLAVEWNKNGNWLLTASRDHLIKLYDIRTMKEMRTFRGHKKEVTSVAWHPIHEGLFVSGGGDGSLAYWMVDNDKEVGLLEHAHDQAVWALQFHPLGHILTSGSNDNNTKFWARNRPGDTQEDIFGLVSFAVVGALDKEAKSAAVQALAAAQAAQAAKEQEERDRGIYIPGMGLDEEVVEQMRTDVGMGGGGHNMNSMPLLPDDVHARREMPGIGAKRTLIKQPPAKKAQRQFERMWNVSKPAGGEEDMGDYNGPVDGNGEETGMFKRQKTSLLGPPPSAIPSMISPVLPRGGDMGPPPGGFRGPPPPAPAPMHSPVGNMPWNSNMAKGGPPPLPMPPPLPAASSTTNESWKRPTPQQGGGDMDYRQMGSGGGPSPFPPSTSSGGDVDLRQQPWNNGAFASPIPPSGDPRMRQPQGGIDFSDDVRDPRRRMNGQNGSGGSDMLSPWASGAPPGTQGGGGNQFPFAMSHPPPMQGGQGDFEGRRGGGMRGGGRGGRGGFDGGRGGRGGFDAGRGRGGGRGRGRGRGSF